MLNWIKGRKAPKPEDQQLMLDLEATPPEASAPAPKPQLTQKEAAFRAVKEAQASIEAKKTYWAEEARRSKTALDSFRNSEKELDDQLQKAMEALPSLREEVLDFQYKLGYYNKQLEEASLASDERAKEVLDWLASQDLDI